MIAAAEKNWATTGVPNQGDKNGSGRPVSGVLSTVSLHRPPEREGPAPVTLDELMAAVADGDQEAFGRLYGAVVYPVMNLVRLLLRDASLAEEVTQEVLLAVWLNAGRFDPLRGRAGAWIIGIARSRAIDRLRSVGAQRGRDDRYFQEAPQTGPSAADSVLARLEAVRVHQALGVLKSTQRQAVLLAFFGGFSYPEVAELLEIPLPTVKSRIQSGLKKLRAHLDNEQSERRRPELRVPQSVMRTAN